MYDDLSCGNPRREQPTDEERAERGHRKGLDRPVDKSVTPTPRQCWRPCRVRANRFLSNRHDHEPDQYRDD